MRVEGVMLKEYDVLGKIRNDKFSQELDALDYDLFPQFVRMRLNEKEFSESHSFQQRKVLRKFQMSFS